jgi:hypothetical protein
MSRKRDQLHRELGGTLVLTSHDDVIKERERGLIFIAQTVHFPNNFGGAMWVG